MPLRVIPCFLSAETATSANVKFSNPQILNANRRHGSDGNRERSMFTR